MIIILNLSVISAGPHDAVLSSALLNISCTVM